MIYKMKYLLTYQIEIDAFDDPDVRNKASDIEEITHVTELSEYTKGITSIKRKLQEIQDNNPPRKIEL